LFELPGANIYFRIGLQMMSDHSSLPNCQVHHGAKRCYDSEPDGLFAVCPCAFHDLRLENEVGFRHGFLGFALLPHIRQIILSSRQRRACLWRIVISPMIRQYSPSRYDSAMRNPLVLLIHLYI
jgi:hypothetical protein